MAFSLPLLFVLLRSLSVLLCHLRVDVHQSSKLYFSLLQWAERFEGLTYLCSLLGCVFLGWQLPRQKPLPGWKQSLIYVFLFVLGSLVFTLGVSVFDRALFRVDYALPLNHLLWPPMFLLLFRFLLSIATEES